MLAGVLVYSTCSTQREQNEDVVEWLVEQQGGVDGAVQLCSVFSSGQAEEMSELEEQRLLHELRARAVAAAESGDVTQSDLGVSKPTIPTFTHVSSQPSDGPTSPNRGAPSGWSALEARFAMDPAIDATRNACGCLHSSVIRVVSLLQSCVNCDSSFTTCVSYRSQLSTDTDGCQPCSTFLLPWPTHAPEMWHTVTEKWFSI